MSQEQEVLTYERDDPRKTWGFLVKPVDRVQIWKALNKFEAMVHKRSLEKIAKDNSQSSIDKDKVKRIQ